jgi:hypothetical protein
VPGQEALPAVLAVVLVNQREVVVVAAVLGPLVQLVKLAEGRAQALDLRLLHAVHVHALLQFAALELVLAGGGRAELVARAPQLDEWRDGRLGALGLDGVHVEVVGGPLLLISGRAPVVNPIADELNLLGRGRLPAPRERRELRAVERRLAAQALHQS